MSEYKLVPFEPTPEMIEAAEGAHMPFGDMDLALRMAILAAPAVQGDPVGWYTEDNLNDKSATTYNAEVAQRWRAKGWPVTPFYTAPQPAPDVAELVEIAKEIVDLHDRRRVVLTVHVEALSKALAAHRKGEES